MTEKLYRVDSRRDLPLISHADFSMPMAAFTLIQIDDGKAVRVSLPRKTNWQVGETVQIDDAVVRANLVE